MKTALHLRVYLPQKATRIKQNRHASHKKPWGIRIVSEKKNKEKGGGGCRLEAYLEKEPAFKEKPPRGHRSGKGREKIDRGTDALLISRVEVSGSEN